MQDRKAERQSSINTAMSNSYRSNNSTDSSLISRLDDLVRRSDRGEIAYTAFLTPSDAVSAKDHLKSAGLEDRILIKGGYEDAERVRIFILPEYLVVLGDLDAEPPQDVTDTLRDAVTAVKIQGSGYRSLTHRDYLGSILALGLERNALGDIAVTDEFSAVVITSSKIAEFLSGELDRVASDSVKVSILADTKSISIKRDMQEINDTVASSRLDCIVASLTGISREKAQALIKSGLVELDYRPAQSCDTNLTPPATVSIRGYGKYTVSSFDGETRKGRLRLRAFKYI